MSVRLIARHLGLNRRTEQKSLARSAPPLDYVVGVCGGVAADHAVAAVTGKDSVAEGLSFVENYLFASATLRVPCSSQSFEVGCARHTPSCRSLPKSS